MLVDMQPGDYETSETTPGIPSLGFSSILTSAGCSSSEPGLLQAGQERTCIWTNTYRPL